MRFMLLLIGLLLASSQAFANKIKVYKWVDEKGVVTFSEYRPQEKDYIELEIDGDRVVGGNNEALDYDLSGLQENKTEEGVVEELNLKAQEYCQKAKHNLNVLDSFKQVRVLDDEGEPQVLSEADTLQQRRLAHRQIELFCNDAPGAS